MGGAPLGVPARPIRRAPFGPFWSSCTFRPMKRRRRGGRVGAAMFTPCKGCGHSLWVEVRSAGTFRFLAHFDDDEGSPTYTEHSPSCRTCGLRLDAALPPGSSSPVGGPPVRGHPAPATVIASRVLISMEPLMYAEALAASVLGRRPHAEVTLLGPSENLAAGVGRVRPHLVVANRVAPGVREIVASWAEVAVPSWGEGPNEKPKGLAAEIGVDGTATKRVEDLGTGDLLAALERAEELLLDHARADARGGGGP